MTVWMKREQMISIVDIAAMEIGVGRTRAGPPRLVSCLALGVHRAVLMMIPRASHVGLMSIFPQSSRARRGSLIDPSSRLAHPPSPVRLDLEWRG